MNTPPSVPVRLASLDAYRGFVMFLMMAEVLELAAVSAKLPQSETWKFLAKHQTHVDWAGWVLHDLIQPSFTFLVGVALPFSLASRLARGQSRGRILVHALWRALLLTWLGVFLRSMGHEQTRYTFEDTLSQIGLGYFFLVLLGFLKPGWWWVALVVILVGYWAAFALYPLPGPDFDYTTTGKSAEWIAKNVYHGFPAHWNINTNPAWAFDTWFLNLFPREKTFIHNGDGYSTLSFIPTLGTMILGLIASGWLKAQGPSWSKILRLVLAGGACLAIGHALDHFGICPNVKKIWTPTWTIYSGGLCFLLLAGFYATIDWPGLPGWSFPLRVIGANSIVAYCMAHLFNDFLIRNFKTHLGQTFFSGEIRLDLIFFHGKIPSFQAWDPVYEPFAIGVAVLLVYWLILFWMYRQKVFVRI